LKNQVNNEMNDRVRTIEDPIGALEHKIRLGVSQEEMRKWMKLRRARVIADLLLNWLGIILTILPNGLLQIPCRLTYSARYGLAFASMRSSSSVMMALTGACTPIIKSTTGSHAGSFLDRCSWPWKMGGAITSNITRRWVLQQIRTDICTVFPTRTL